VSKETASDPMLDIQVAEQQGREALDSNVMPLFRN
jgi:hypothetical protein